jgi:hypothetical protein
MGDLFVALNNPVNLRFYASGKTRMDIASHAKDPEDRDKY